MTIIKSLQKTIQKLLKPTELSVIDYQIKRKEEEGIEVKPIFFKHRDKKIRHYYQINPLDRLRQKNIISDSEYISAKQYQHDFELANQAHHARMNYDSILTSGGKSEARELEEKHIKASENIERIKQIIAEKEEVYQKFCEERGGRSRQAGYLKILELLIEKQMMLGAVSLALGFRPEQSKTIISRTCVAVKILDNYYSN